jgi:hypothetical protein
MTTLNDNPSDSSPSTQPTKRGLYDIEIDCHECDARLDIRHLYEAFLVELHDEIKKMPLTYESRCPSCKSCKILPSYVWGRYCETPGCKYKLPAPFAVVSIGGSQAEDIVSLILKKFK